MYESIILFFSFFFALSFVGIVPGSRIICGPTWRSSTGRDHLRVGIICLSGNIGPQKFFHCENSNLLVKLQLKRLKSKLLKFQNI